MPPRDNFFDPLAVRAPREENVVSCTKCGCQWMELVEVFQFPEYHSVILGQKPPIAKGPYFFYRCPKCQEVYQPSIQYGARDSARASYDAFVKHMQTDLEVATDGEKV